MNTSDNIYKFLADSVSSWPGKKAVVKSGASFTYADIETRCQALCAELGGCGLEEGDRVGIYLDKNPDQVASIFAAAKKGAIFVILNTKLKKDQIAHIMGDCRIKIVITSKPLAHAILATSPAQLGCRSVIYAEEGKYFSTDIGSSAAKVPQAPPPAEGIACIIYTSGSTGMPKGVMVTHKNLSDGARIVSAYLDCRHDDKVLSLLPFSFDYGLNQLLTTFRNGATIVLHNYVFPDEVLGTIEKERITALAGIPTIWLGLMNATSLSKYNYESLRYITNSGGKIPVEYVKKLISSFSRSKLYLMYGLTEAFRSTYLDPALVASKPDSIGKAIPEVKISVLNKEGMECAPGEEGELIHRGALISLGYWNNKEATEKIIKPLPAGAEGKQKNEIGVFSGDIVKRDSDGFLYYIGRNDEMIKSSGYRISPAEIEEVIYSMEGISAAVVFGKEDPFLGQKIVAVVQSSGGGEAAKRRIADECSKRLPDYAVPSEIVMVDDMPKTTSGKLDRALIKEMYGRYK
ncbi:MAG: acyl-CoA ligase (AMP-forming), exosortase A system-associated [Candidatus Omnitrophica bacterium]|nr:acyl-CoA ligase (AMP-forming), exosortase A system-associated [Candidatus Omnitrophota bacterium]MCM8791343.1 acyl-CoA ligase (AMP-forming), exosortase A system-associated [Candidatus Omnitrophota bacterium]